jgi:adenylate cyclase
VPISTTERRLAAIVAADVAGYSRLIGADEAETLAALRAHRRELIDPLIAQHKGHIVKTTGDGLLMEFPSVVEAVACAVQLQRSMAERNRDVPPERRIAFRIGINIGDVVVEDGDVFGDGVNVAARLEQLAEPGAICLSEDAYRQVRGKIEIDATDAGAQHLKNIANPVRVYRIDPAATPTAKRRAAARRMLGARRLWWMAAGAAAGLAALAGFFLWLALDLGPTTQAPSDAKGLGQGLPILAVLPFANQTGEQSQEYFADGVTEEVINALGRFKSLRVISHNAVMPYKTKPATPAQIGTELGADYLVGGSIRRSEQRVRISAQLTEVGSSTVVWTNRYDGELSDIFDFQDALARDIAGTLATNITQLEVRRRLESEKPDQSAFDLVLRARSVGMASSRSANRQYRELMTRAIELDPKYATAHALLAEAIYSQVIGGWTEFPDQALDRAEELARRAIALAPDEPDGYRALGRVHLIRAEYDQARSALQRAIEINPSDANALSAWGKGQLYSGEISGATEALELAFRYNPLLEPEFHFDLSLSYYLARRHEEALRTAERGISRFPDFPMLQVAAAAAAAQSGRSEQAAHHVAEIRRRLPFLDLDQLGSRFTNAAYPAYLRDGLKLAGL